MTVTIVPVIPSSRVRASSGVPWNASGERGPTLTDDSSAPAASAASTDSVWGAKIVSLAVTWAFRQLARIR